MSGASPTTGASAQSSMASAARTQQATGFDAINQQRQALQWAREDAATRDPSGRYVGPAPGAGKQRVFIPRGQPDPMSGAQAYDQAIVPSVGTGDWNTAYDELQQARDPIELIDRIHLFLLVLSRHGLTTPTGMDI